MSTFIIAELGINHEGDISLCKEMIYAAKESGADAVKLQINNPKNISAVPWLVDVQTKTTLSPVHIQDAIDYADNIGIEVFSSIGDVSSVDLFKQFNFRRVKISSSNLLNAPLHEAVAEMMLPVLVSTGDADIESISRVVHFYRQNSVDITLLHCIPKYPAKWKDANLGGISFLRDTCGCPVGYSDHTEGAYVSECAVAIGAEVIEKHFTIDKKGAGPDHHFSADPSEFMELVNRVRDVEVLLGNAQNLYDAKRDWTSSAVRRAIVFRTDMTQGCKINEDDILVARPLVQDMSAINPLDYREVVGKTLASDVEAFHALTPELLLDVAT